jgi:DnaJ-domain-containing protein 1
VGSTEASGVGSPLHRQERYQTGGGEDEARGVSSWCNPLKDYYKILGLDKSAALAEIKKSYKRLALQYHPVSA